MNSESQYQDERSQKQCGVEIRAARMSDAEAIALIANLPGYRAGTLRLPFQSVEETRQWMEKPALGSINLVAVLDGQIVGNAGMRRHAGRQIHTGHLGMGVHDDFTGRGIGSALLAAVVDTADNWLAIKRLELTVYVDNEPAIRLYEKFGFETEGRLRAFAFRNGEYVDAFAMARVRM
ncbi:GNAT family N-acetyltransferase [Rhizobium sp. CB3090]|uniref:GNAT family N-acetyltransferase n=1 Tax=Rhizobium sp. CB3090 TaxID=3039156 RepID=UPI0024B133DE|nr:GNAT family N-acetyltransferase [Rhizobium sp. CB3090]WFU11022.1 GNAT family N-acetyltransferase [Rhizobium sp. CB3090]